MPSPFDTDRLIRSARRADRGSKRAAKKREKTKSEELNERLRFRREQARQESDERARQEKGRANVEGRKKETSKAQERGRAGIGKSGKRATGKKSVVSRPDPSSTTLEDLLIAREESSFTPEIRSLIKDDEERRQGINLNRGGFGVARHRDQGSDPAEQQRDADRAREIGLLPELRSDPLLSLFLGPSIADALKGEGVSKTGIAVDAAFLFPGLRALSAVKTGASIATRSGVKVGLREAGEQFGRSTPLRSAARNTFEFLRHNPNRFRVVSHKGVDALLPAPNSILGRSVVGLADKARPVTGKLPGVKSNERIVAEWVKHREDTISKLATGDASSAAQRAKKLNPGELTALRIMAEQGDEGADAIENRLLFHKNQAEKLLDQADEAQVQLDVLNSRGVIDGRDVTKETRKAEKARLKNEIQAATRGAYLHSVIHTESIERSRKFLHFGDDGWELTHSNLSDIYELAAKGGEAREALISNLGFLADETMAMRVHGPSRVIHGAQYADDKLTAQRVAAAKGEAENTRVFLTSEARRRGRDIPKQLNQLANESQKRWNAFNRIVSRGSEEHKLLDMWDTAQKRIARVNKKLNEPGKNGSPPLSQLAHSYDELNAMVAREERYVNDAWERWNRDGVGRGRLERRARRHERLVAERDKLSVHYREYLSANETLEKLQTRLTVVNEKLKDLRGAQALEAGVEGGAFEAARAQTRALRAEYQEILDEVDTISRKVESDLAGATRKILDEKNTLVGADDKLFGQIYAPSNRGLPLRARASKPSTWSAAVRAFAKGRQTRVRLKPNDPSLRNSFTGRGMASGYFTIDVTEPLYQSVLKANNMGRSKRMKDLAQAVGEETPTSVKSIPVVVDDELAASRIPTEMRNAWLDMEDGNLMGLSVLDETPESQVEALRNAIMPGTTNLGKGSIKDAQAATFGMGGKRFEGMSVEQVAEALVEEGGSIPGVAWVDPVFAEHSGIWSGGVPRQVTDLALREWRKMDSLDAGKALLNAGNNIQKIAALYANPSYGPVQFIGNMGMLIQDQGVFAPLSMLKAWKATSRIDDDGLNQILDLMGIGWADAAEILKNSGPTNALAHITSIVIDQAPRKAAWVHQARRAGLKSGEQISEALRLSKQHALGDGSEQAVAAFNKVQAITAKAKTTIGDFDRLGHYEKALITRTLWFYPWTKAAWRWSKNFPIDHPYQAATIGYLMYLQQSRKDEPTPWYDQFVTELGLSGRVGDKEFPLALRLNQFSPFFTPWELGNSLYGLAVGDSTREEFLGNMTPMVEALGVALRENSITEGAREIGGRLVGPELGGRPGSGPRARRRVGNLLRSNEEREEVADDRSFPTNLEQDILAIPFGPSVRFRNEEQVVENALRTKSFDAITGGPKLNDEERNILRDIQQDDPEHPGSVAKLFDGTGWGEDTPVYQKYKELKILRMQLSSRHEEIKKERPFEGTTEEEKKLYDARKRLQSLVEIYDKWSDEEKQATIDSIWSPDAQLELIEDLEDRFKNEYEFAMIREIEKSVDARKEFLKSRG